MSSVISYQYITYQLFRKVKLSRRELLTAFLGAPFAMAACRESASLNFPVGEIVGQNVELGHLLLRDEPSTCRRQTGRA